MATGRILKNQISLSEQVNDLSIHAALLFTWMITHADDFGRMHGSYRKIKAQVVPMRDDFNTKKVTDCIAEIEKANLIQRYEIEGEFYIQFPSWESHQSGLHKRTSSKFPDPKKFCFPEIPGNSPLTEQNRTGTGTEQEYSCPEPKNSGLEEEKTIAVIELPLNVTGTYHEVTQASVDEWAMLYPAVDVMQELRSMVGWLNANKEKRKTKAGVGKFINSWLTRKQDNPAQKKPASQPSYQAPQKTKAQQRTENNLNALMGFVDPLPTITEEFYELELQKTI